MVLQFATADGSSPAYASSVAAAGFATELERLREHAARGHWDAALDAITAEMVDAMTLTGTAAHVRERVAAYRAAGVDAVMAMPSQPGMFYPFYEGHLDGAPFPAFDFAAFTGSIERSLEVIGAV